MRHLFTLLFSPLLWLWDWLLHVPEEDTYPEVTRNEDLIDILVARPRDYAPLRSPSMQELQEWSDQLNREILCTYSHLPRDLDPEDGCVHCGYNAQ